MDTRQQKARAIVAGGKITRGERGYWVPGEGTTHKGELDALFPFCTCPDFELTGPPGKHMQAVRLWLEEEKNGTRPAEPEIPPPPKRPTYKRDNRSFNAAQTAEKGHFLALLADLCGAIPEPPREPRRGRPRIPLADAAFA